MKKSPFFKIIGMLSWIITSLACINIGTTVFGFNFFTTNFVLMNMPWIVMPSYYVIGLSGLVSFIMFLFAIFGLCGCGCGCCGNNDKKHHCSSCGSTPPPFAS